MPTYIPPEAYVLKSIGDYAWIMVGKTSMLLIPAEKDIGNIGVKEKSFLAAPGVDFKQAGSFVFFILFQKKIVVIIQPAPDGGEWFKQTG